MLLKTRKTSTHPYLTTERKEKEEKMESLDTILGKGRVPTYLRSDFEKCEKYICL